MSELPEIDPNKVSQKLLTRLTESIYQSIQLEVLAEALRDERDTANAEVQELQKPSSDTPPAE